MPSSGRVWAWRFDPEILGIGLEVRQQAGEGVVGRQVGLLGLDACCLGAGELQRGAESRNWI
jgi:hypothetical protein